MGERGAVGAGIETHPAVARHSMMHHGKGTHAGPYCEVLPACKTLDVYAVVVRRCFFREKRLPSPRSEERLNSTHIQRGRGGTLHRLHPIQHVSADRSLDGVSVEERSAPKECDSFFSAGKNTSSSVIAPPTDAACGIFRDRPPGRGQRQG